MMRRNGKDACSSTSGARKAMRRLKLALVATCCAAVMAAGGYIAYAVTISPNYDWYTGATGTESDPYVISTRQAFVGFANIVNGTADVDGDGTVDEADTFAGKYVELGANINFVSSALTPAGGTGDLEFDGTFDGQGYTLSSFKLAPASGQTSNIGLIGAAGENSVIKDVNIASNASLTVTQEATTDVVLSNIGALVGYSEGAVSGCTNNAAVTVTSAANASDDHEVVIENVGGLIGICKSDITSCENTGTVSVTGSGMSASDTKTSIVVYVGGVVGCAGDMDSSVSGVEGQTACGLVSHCTNSGTVTTTTPQQAGESVYSPTYVSGNFVGGVIGYSRGSVEYCSNSGYVYSEHGSNFGGVLGSLRAPFSSNGYNGGIAESDDGTADTVIHILGCTNTGNVVDYVCAGGVIGRAGTYCEILGCMNGDPTVATTSSQNWVVATRGNKPCPGGIIGNTYSDVSFCVNYGNVASASWDFVNQTKIADQSGYYSTGIVAMMCHFTDNDNGHATSPVPEVYSCLNLGGVYAIDNMRQRNIAGDAEEGYVLDNFAATGLCWDDYMTFENALGANLAVTSSRIKANDTIQADDAARTDNTGDLITVDSAYVGKTLVEVMNSHAGNNGWSVYWNTSDGSDYPALNLFSTGGDTSIASGTATQIKEAPYTGVAGSVPTFTLTLGGKTLVQDTDFRVVPAASAVAMSQGSTPYTATLVGIGQYTGTLQASYGIGKLDLSTCTVTIGSVEFDYAAHEPDADAITVKTQAGTVVDPSSYTYAFGSTSKDWEDAAAVDGKPVNAGVYDVVFTANAAAGTVEGEVSGNFSITKTSLIYNVDDRKDNPEKFAKSAHATLVNEGTAFQQEWQSFRTLHMSGSSTQESETIKVSFPYTGHVILPTVTAGYNGHQISMYYNVDGAIVHTDTPEFGAKDYDNMLKVIVGGYELEGDQTEIDNIGSPTEVKIGGIIINARMGDNSDFANYTSYDCMEFYIDPSLHASLADATYTLPHESYTYEEGQVYEPEVTVAVLGSQLDLGTDYTITYANNDKPGTATYTVKPGTNGLFVGEYTGTFEIVNGDAYELSYSYDETSKTASVTGVTYTGVTGTYEVVIPSTVKQDGVTYTVTSIADSAFKADSTATNDASKITAVTIPATVKTIGTSAFGADSNKSTRLLAQVKFDDIDNSQLTTIGQTAFKGCNELTEFTFPASVATIGKGAFYMNTTNKLTKLTFLTEDPTMPSSVSTSLTFTNVGYNGTVSVYGYPAATAVQTLVTNNSGTTSGTNAGRNFTFVQMDPPVKHEITTQPASVSVTTGAAASFTVAANDTKATFQWQSSTDQGQTWANIAGATKATYGISATTAADDGLKVRCNVTFSDGTVVTSHVATLTVTEPALKISAECTSADKGEKATVTTTVESGMATTFRFYYSADGTTWTQAAKNATGTVQVTASPTNAARQWKVVAYATDGTTAEASFEVTINDPVAVTSTTPAAKYNAKATVNVSVSHYGTYGPAKYKYYYSADNGVTWKQVAYHNKQYTDTDSLQVTANGTNAKRLWKVIVTFKDGRTAEAPFTVSYGK